MGLTARLFAAAAAIASAVLIALEARPLADVFLRADPTLQGSFSLLHARPFLSVAAHCGLIVLAVHGFFTAAPQRSRARLGMLMSFGALGLEVLSLAPCLIAADALCGVYYIVIGPFAALIMLAGFAIYLAASGSRGLTQATALGVVSLGAAALAAYWIVTPHAPADCTRIASDIQRDSCVMNFALQTNDAQLCEQVNFDGSRWSCTYQIAERKGDATLCDRISPPCRYTGPGPACEPERFRDTCYLVVARRLRDGRLCERITPGDMQTNCRAQAR